MPQLQKQAHYVIKVEGSVNSDLADWFGPVEVASVEEDVGRVVTILTGIAADQAELVGLIRHLHGLGFVLLSVEQAAERTQ